MLHAYETPPVFVSDVDMPLGEGDLDILTHNAILLDALSFRAPETMASSAGKDTSTPHAYTGLATEIIWRGSFYRQTGQTTLTIEGWGEKGATENFQVFLNSAGLLTQAVPTAGAFTLTVSISSVAVGSFGEVVLQISGARTPAQALAAKYVVYDAYLTPAPTLVNTWPGTLPTFAGTYSASLLNTLGAAQAYLAERLNSIPFPPFMSANYTHGSSVTSDVYPLWWGGVERANGANILNIRIVPMVIANVAEYYRVLVNGSIVHTGATMGPGTQRDDYLSIDLSAQAASTRLETTIETVITTGAAAGPSGDRNSRYHLWAVRMSNSAPATASAPTEFTAGESISATTVNTRLNALCSMCSGAKARMDANPRIFDRVRLMRRTFGRDSGQWTVFDPDRIYVERFVRKGSRLVVRGQGVRVGWGGISTKSDKSTTNTYSVDFAHSEPLTDGDAYQTKTIYLDSLPYLRRGQSYHVYASDLVFATEFLL